MAQTITFNEHSNTTSSTAVPQLSPTLQKSYTSSTMDVLDGDMFLYTHKVYRHKGHPLLALEPITSKSGISEWAVIHESTNSLVTTANTSEKAHEALERIADSGLSLDGTADYDPAYEMKHQIPVYQLIEQLASEGITDEVYVTQSKFSGEYRMMLHNPY